MSILLAAPLRMARSWRVAVCAASVLGALTSCGGGSSTDGDPSNADSGRAKILRVGATTYVVAGDATDSVFSEAGKLVRADENIGALGNNLFGEQVNLYDGSTSFVQTDVSLPGNSPLPVSVGRRFTTGKPQFLTSHFGDWDLDIPHLHGVFANSMGWKVGSGVQSATDNRCTQFGPPPQALGQNNQGSFNPVEYWHGSFLYVPGAGSQEILQANTSASAVNYTGAPTGQATPLTTKDRWTIVCGTPLKNGAGEGFTAIAPDGTRYQFDWMVSRAYSQISKPYGTPPENLGTETTTSRTKPADPGLFAGGYLLKRKEVWIMPTLVTDRYGNTVVYSFDSAQPWRLNKIESTEAGGTPRTITFTYQNDTLNPSLISSISDGTRTWQYGYADFVSSGTVYGKTLTSVTLPPGGGTWAIDMAAVGAPGPMTQGGGGYCDSVPEGTLPQGVGKMTHPAGAQGTFKLAPVLHGRSYVDRYCMGSESDATGWSYYPVYFLSYALKSKTISGPGLPAADPDAAAPGGMTWTYTYGPHNGSFAPCSGCAETKTVTVTDPDGNNTLHTFGNKFRVTEGQLQRVDEVLVGATAQRSTVHEYAAPNAGPYPDPIGYSVQMRTAGDLSTRHTPQRRRSIIQRATNQDASTFTWQVNVFDNLARPITVRRFSSLGDSPFSPLGNERTETTAYGDNTTRWVMGQVASVTEPITGKVMESHTYDPLTLNRASSSSFGLPPQTFTYWDDGTLKTSANPAGHTTSFSNYRRGLAQDVTYADGNTEHAVVNNLGGIDSLRNAVYTTTSYVYDAMGRLAGITPPGDSGVSYKPTTLNLQRLTASEGAIPAGYWKQTVTTGNALTERYFDTLWRPVLTRTRDSTLANTGSATLKRYDTLGRGVFDSYPVRDIAALSQSLNGTERVFDTLGRVTAVKQDSEQTGPQGSKLVTSTVYLGGSAGFGRTVTNPAGNSTTAYFRVLDSPSEDALTTLMLPQGVTVGINRDTFGKPYAITRAGGGKSLMRQYFFDANERLCKTLEPETGATIVAYHPAGNVAWRASGLNLPSGSCDQASVPENKKISFGYDPRGRLTSTSYGDNSPGSTRTYHPDGLLATAQTPTSTWTYQYNNRRLLTLEKLAIDGAEYSFPRTPNDYGQVASQGYADGAVLQHSLNALGQPLALVGYADQIDWHPNGALHTYRLPNAGNRVHTVELNVRGLPETWVDSGVLSDTYTYDRNGNVKTITDQLGGTNTRVMNYDGLDRLISATASGLWGSGTYTYDALDNLMASTVGNRNAVATIGASNRLDALTINGGAAIAFTYDDNGNVTSRGGQAFDFDIGNRLKSAAGVASYTYDAHGRRVRVLAADGSVKLQFYSLSGQLLMGKQTSSAGAVTTERYIYLAGKLIATTHNQTGTRWEHTDALGSPVAHVDAVGGITKTQFEPYGAVAAGASPNPMGFTGHVNDAETGLVYMQQRYYDPVAGRFLSVDPVVTDADTGRSFNRYQYASSNPFSFLDPDGMDEAPTNVIEKNKKRESEVCKRNRCEGVSSVKDKSGAKGVPATPTAPVATPVATTAVAGRGLSLPGAAGWLTRLFGAFTLALVPTEAGRDSDKISLFRAVGAPELLDIQTTGRFNPAPNGSEMKQFWFSRDDANTFMDRMNFMLNSNEYQNIVLVKVLVSTVGSAQPSTDLLNGRTRPSVTFGFDTLPLLNRDAQRNGIEVIQ